MAVGVARPRAQGQAITSTDTAFRIAAEGVARWGAGRYDLPTTIARLSVPYGDNGGWPAVHLELMLAGRPVQVHIDAPSVYHPIHIDDIVANPSLRGVVFISDKERVFHAGADLRGARGKFG